MLSSNMDFTISSQKLQQSVTQKSMQAGQDLPVESGPSIANTLVAIRQCV